MNSDKYVLQEVVTPALEREWLDLPKKIYKGNRNWVCPLDTDIRKVFDPARNEQFADGEAVRWVVRNRAGEVVGRIAAFYNREKAALEEQPTGGCGFFEAIDDQQVADMLFEASRMWLASRGMEAMDGPINFGQRDAWWGLLVEGYEFQPLYENPYNPPYYKELFENYGFRNYFNQNTYIWKIYDDDVNAMVHDRAKRLFSTPGYGFRQIDMSRIEEEAENFTGLEGIDTETAEAGTMAMTDADGNALTATDADGNAVECGVTDLGNGMESVTYGTVTEDPVNFSVADTLNTIVPKLVPLMLTLLLYYMFAKHSWTPTKGILLLFVLGILGAGPLGLWPSIW